MCAVWGGQSCRPLSWLFYRMIKLPCCTHSWEGTPLYGTVWIRVVDRTSDNAVRVFGSSLEGLKTTRRALRWFVSPRSTLHVHHTSRGSTRTIQWRLFFLPHTRTELFVRRLKNKTVRGMLTIRAKANIVFSLKTAVTAKRSRREDSLLAGVWSWQGEVLIEKENALMNNDIGWIFATPKKI